MFGFDILGIVTVIGAFALVMVFFFLAFRKEDPSILNEQREEKKK